MDEYYTVTITAALVNREPGRTGVSMGWSDLGLTGRQPVRDLWQQKDLGAADGSFAAEVPAHGAVLVKIGRGKPVS